MDFKLILDLLEKGRLDLEKSGMGEGLKEKGTDCFKGNTFVNSVECS